MGNQNENSKVRDENFITVMGWMRKIPEIQTSTELLAYALIYGFSQVDGQYLTCKQTYIASWIGLTRSKCNELLIRMENKGLIKKSLVRRHGAIKQYKYWCVKPDFTSSQTEHDEFLNGTRASSQTEHATSSQTEHAYNNNIYNNNLYKSRAREEKKKCSGSFNEFMTRDYTPAFFEQLEMQIVENSKDDKARK